MSKAQRTPFNRRWIKKKARDLIPGLFIHSSVLVNERCIMLYCALTRKYPTDICISGRVL